MEGQKIILETQLEVQRFVTLVTFKTDVPNMFTGSTVAT